MSKPYDKNSIFATTPYQRSGNHCKEIDEFIAPPPAPPPDTDTSGEMFRKHFWLYRLIMKGWERR